jgi:adenosylmethionine---8-amino-7-oxononanoate aminotransferase
MMRLLEEDQQYVWHPFTQHKTVHTLLPVTQAKGLYLYDEDNNAYIDAISSWWTNTHGHSHPYIAQKIYEQANMLAHVMFAGVTHKPAVELAKKLLALLPPHFSKVFYSDNGSTAVEVALKMCIQYWQHKQQPKRNKILAFHNSYHGDCFGAMSVSDRGSFTLPFHNYLFDVIFLDTPNEQNISSIKATIHKHAAEICCFIYEPLVQGAGGMHMYEPYFLNELLNTIRLADIICIADEVMTGFGRTGQLFASSYMHKQPDIICLSKAITGGTLPLAATIVPNFVYEAFLDNDILKTFFHGHSYTANPIACAAALASMELLTQPTTLLAIEMITANNKNFVQTLQGIKGINTPRSLGTILAFEIAHHEKIYTSNIKEETMQLALTKGIFIRPLGNTVYIMPPYCITENELNKLQAFLLEIAERNWVE